MAPSLSEPYGDRDAFYVHRRALKIIKSHSQGKKRKIGTDMSLYVPLCEKGRVSMWLVTPALEDGNPGFATLACAALGWLASSV